MFRQVAAGLLLAASALFAQLPPLIDRELLFDDPEISGAQISPDGKYIAFMKPWNKNRNIWVKKAEEPFAAAKLVTAETKRPIPGYFWSRDGKFILFVQDQAGDENYNVFAVNPADSATAGAQAPPARNVTDAKGIRAMIYAVPKTDPDVIYVGFNDRDKAWHDLYKVKISTGERTLVRTNTERIVGFTFDNKDQLRLATRVNDAGETEILRADADAFKKIYTCTVFETCAPVRFHKDNKQVYLLTNKGDDKNLIQLSLLDPATGAEQFVESDPLKRVDLSGVMVSDVTNEIIGTTYNDERVRISWKNKEFEADYRLLQKKIPGKEVRFASHTADERLWLISAFSDMDPGSTYLFDRKTKKLTLQYQVRENLPRAHLAPMQAIRYESTDGLEIPAYLTLPKGVPPKDLPLVVVPHGGPWYRDSWSYNSFAQFLANRGYAVLQPNFRGSTGYGKKFLNAGNKQWGQKMQDDLTWGVKNLVAKGMVDPKRAAIMGGSYGGYATLAGVAFTPDVYAAAVSIVGPSNLFTLLDSFPPYWEAARTLFYNRMGDPRTPEGKEQLRKQSPLFSADKIKAPLLVVQGANDPRVTKIESDQIVVALRDRNFPVEYLVAPDEGHGFARPVNSMSMFATAEKFLAKHIGGRFQESMTPEVATRLKEITVDPKTVTLAKKVDASAVGLPKLAAALVVQTLKYGVKLNAGGQTMDMSLSSEVKEDAAGWLIVDTVTTPMGAMSDEAVVDKKTLALMKRTVKQGPININIDVKENKAVGNLSMQGKDKPIDVELGGPLFADGAGASQVLATLPLAEGYTVTFRNFDVQKMKPKMMQLKVVGSEKVKVPAGEFDAFKVEVTAADGGPENVTAWYAKDSRKPVKMIIVLGQMGGATMTAELQ
jgi:dipeptidyl aminopeptidase/acylaminoacyl peptidase